MDIRKLQRAIVDGLEDVKAVDIRVFNTEHMSPLFERVIVASGTSNRQTKALATSVRESVKAKGFPVPRSEGEDNGEWIIVDCGAAVAHIMQPAIRDYYRLEEIWGAKPVSMRIASQKGAAKGSDSQGLPVKAAVKKAAVKKPAEASKVGAKKPATAKPTGGAYAGKRLGPKPAAKKAVAKRAPAKKVVAKKLVVKTPATPFSKRG